MRFSLLALITLVTLVAVEMVTLKTTSETRLVIVGYVVYATLLAATWGAFCCNGVLRQFCKGFAVLAWASVLYGVFVREESFVNFSVSPLAKLMAEFLEHPVPTDLDPFSSRNADRSEYLFFKLWNYWSILNAGVLGGFIAMQVRQPLLVGTSQEKSQLPQAPQATVAVPMASPISEIS